MVWFCFFYVRFQLLLKLLGNVAEINVILYSFSIALSFPNLPSRRNGRPEFSLTTDWLWSPRSL